MNGDSNGTMGEPMGTSVLDENNCIPDIKKMTSESLANGINCENSNITDNENTDDNIKDCKSYDSNETQQDQNCTVATCDESDPLGNSQDAIINNSDEHTQNSQDIKANNMDDGSDDSRHNKPSSEQNNLGDSEEPTTSQGSSEETEIVQGNNKDNNDKLLKEHLPCEMVNNSNLSVGPSQENDTNLNSGTVLEQATCDNSIESNHSSDETSESEEDTAGDTMSGGENEKGAVGSNENKYDDGDSKIETFKIVTIDQHHSDQEGTSINLSDYSGSEGETKAEDTVSIDSDSGDDSHKAGVLSKSNESIILIENDGSDSHNGTSKKTKTIEVHEIVSDNDDCVVTSEEKLKKDISKKKRSPKGIPITQSNDTQVGLRRSSRSIKRKKYDDDIQHLEDESDVEEVVMEDPLKRKSKNFNYKSSAVTASKQGKSNMNQKQEVNLVIIDSPVSGKSIQTPTSKSGSPNLNQNIYQTITSRGTSVTPVSSKNSSLSAQSTQASQTLSQAPSQPILPTLTDDMFVVEAPSFIVPYVYEKPAKMPFKEFVDNWGKELAEERAKEEQEILEKKKQEKAKREEEKKEKRERGEKVEESEEEVDTEEVKKKKVEKTEKAVKRERRRRKKEDDDVSWDGSSSEESEDDDTISDDDSQITVIKEKADIIEEIKEIGELTTDTAPKSESYFDLFLGKFFMNIGLNLVQEYVQTDLLKQQKRKLQREKKGGHDTQDRLLSIALLTKNLELSQKNNAFLKFEQLKCEFCSFTTESKLALAHHLETPHMKNNMYSCNHCRFETRSPHDILFHMEKGHGTKARLERALGSHQCANCPFEDNGKGKLARHMVACAKKFKPDINLAPPAEWEHPAKIAKVSRARQNMAPFQVTSQFGRHHVDGTGHAKVPIPIANAMPPLTYRPRNRAAHPRQPLNIPVQMRPSGVLIRQAPPSHHNYPGNARKSNPSLSITPLPRQQVPVPAQPLHTANAKGFVICEICDGYIKDLEQLRNHMQWIHKVKIHPKMIYNRPPLNCQKCQFRFFTDQGLERHLLGSHGLVTSSMQEAANKGKDAGRCPVCGRVYQWKLLSHVSRDHNLVLKPAHLSYKCTVCTATFSMYRQFENHVYSAHSVVAKKVMDKKTTAAASKANANDNAAKQLKINDEITIIPQPAKVSTAK